MLKSLKRAGDVSLVVWSTFQTSFISWAAYMLISELAVKMLMRYAFFMDGTCLLSSHT